MVKIPLFKGNRLGFERSLVTLSIKYGNLPSFFAEALVDTGCPFTVISESKMKKTRIPYSDKPTSYSNVQVGNIIMELKDLGVCEISFRDENNKIVKINQQIFVGVPITKGYLSQELPSFLGQDILKNHHISIMNNKSGSDFLFIED